MRSHSVTCHLIQVNTPRLNASQTGRYSIYLPWGMEGWVDPCDRLRCRDGSPAHRRSPIQVLTQQRTPSSRILATYWQQVRRPNHCTSKPLDCHLYVCLWRCALRLNDRYSKVPEQVNRKCLAGNTTVQLSIPYTDSALRLLIPQNFQCSTIGYLSNSCVSWWNVDDSAADNVTPAPTRHVRTVYVCFLRLPQGFPLQAFLPTTFTATFVTVVIFGHYNR